MLYHSPARIVECVSECMLLIKKKTHTHTRTNTKHKKKSRLQKAEETKEEKIISVVNLTGYDDIVCKFSLCTFNLLDPSVNFSWFFI